MNASNRRAIPGRHRGTAMNRRREPRKAENLRAESAGPVPDVDLAAQHVQQTRIDCRCGIGSDRHGSGLGLSRAGPEILSGRSGSFDPHGALLAESGCKGRHATTVPIQKTRGGTTRRLIGRRHGANSPRFLRRASKDRGRRCRSRRRAGGTDPPEMPHA